MKRPDLDQLEADMKIPTFYGSARAMIKLQSLLTYARHLEADNKRLRERALAAEQVIHEELPT